MRHLEDNFNRLTHFLAVLVAISIGSITLLIPTNLVMVKLGVGGIWWLFEAVEYALYVGVFIAAPWVLHHGAHVRVDVVVGALSQNAARKLELIADAVGIGLCLLLCFYGIRAAMMEFEDGTLPDKDLRIANWYMMSIFALSFLLLATEFLFRIYRVLDGREAIGVSAKSGF